MIDVSDGWMMVDVDGVAMCCFKLRQCKRLVQVSFLLDRSSREG
jgi:hypothetical protein